MINMKCENCGTHKTARVMNMKQGMKRGVIFALVFVAVFLWLATTGSLLALVALPIVAVWGTFYIFAVGKKDKYIIYKCAACGNTIKVKNLRYKN